MKKTIVIFILLFTLKGTSQCIISFSIQVTPPTCIGCCDGSAQIINLSGGCLPFSFTWSPTGSSTYSINNLCSGSYSATVYDMGCCPSVTQGCFVPSNTTTNILINSIENYIISVSPNPNNGNFQIKSSSINENTTVKITDVLGQQKQVIYTISNNNIEINITDEVQGIYWLDLNSNNLIIHKKILVLSLPK